MFTLATVIVWWTWEDVVVYSTAVYTRPGDAQYDEFSVRVPTNATTPLTVLVALHGMGGTGQREREGVRQQADANGWVIVAPTFGYARFEQPDQLRVEEPINLARLAAFLDRLPDLTGAPVKQQVLLYGFSRGGQTAHRFALAYPDRVAAAAVMAAGTYTLPSASFNDRDASFLPFPYGVADLGDLFGHPFAADQFARIPFWVGVGARDSLPSDVPREWDPYLGTNRLDRAEEFAGWLTRTGSQAEFRVFPGVAHLETGEMRSAALRFLAANT